MGLLQTNEAVLAKLVRDSPLAIVISTLADDEILDVNDSFLHLFGYTRDEVIGQTAVGLGLWVDPTQRTDLKSKLADKQSVRDCETTVRTKTATERQVLASIEQVEIDGQACLLTQLYDVTAFRQVETRFPLLVEQLPVITYAHELGERRTLTYISPQVETILGYSPAEVLAGEVNFYVGRVHPEDQARLNASRQTGPPLRPYRVEYRVQAADGRWVWLQDQAAVVRDADGHPLLWQGILVDITARKAAEESLREAEARFRGLFRTVSEAILVADADGRYVDANPAAIALLGYDREELLRMCVADLITGVPESTAIEYAPSKEGSWRREMELRRKDGSTVPMEISATVVALPTGAMYLSVGRDVSERKQAEALLKASEERFRALVQNSYDIIVVLDADGVRKYASPSVEQLLGYSPANLIGSSAMSLVHPDDAPRLREAIQFCVHGGKQTPVLELRLRHRDGSWRDFEAIGTNLLQEPSVAGIVFNSRDITVRKAAEVALQKSEERFRSAFDHAPIGMALVTKDGRFLQVNHSLCTILASSEAELLGKSFAEITLAEDRDVDGDLARQLLRGEIASFQVEKRLVRQPDEEVIWGRVTVSLVRGSRSEPLYFVAQIQDITPFKAAGAALRKSAEQFRSAFDHAPIGMALVAPDGRFTRVNRALCELVGFTEEELLGKTLADITHPDDLADDAVHAERLWAGEIDTYQMETRCVHKDGRIIWILLTGSAVDNDGEPSYVIAQLLDITGRRHVEMERAVMLASEREYSRQLQALTEMRADLAAMIAHELRAPVSALRMMTFLLAPGDLAPEAQAEMLAAATREIDQLDRLINDIEAAAAAEREDLSIQLHPVPLTVLLESARSFAQTSLLEHSFSMSDVPPVRVWCDPERISQVLRNLLDNAAKHTPPGTPVALRVDLRGTRMAIEVSDQGPGLTEDEVSLIFEKFGRGRQAAARQTPGAGLGLYLSRLIVEAHGSELTVESIPGSRTRFTFALEIVS